MNGGMMPNNPNMRNNMMGDDSRASVPMNRSQNPMGSYGNNPQQVNPQIRIANPAIPAQAALAQQQMGNAPDTRITGPVR